MADRRLRTSCWRRRSARRWNGTISFFTPRRPRWCSGRCSFRNMIPRSDAWLPLPPSRVGFLARPFGGLFFGHFGDRWGRKPMLVATLLLVGGSTFADRAAADLCPGRHLGAGAASAAAPDPGLWRRRRIWRRGGDGGGVCAARQARPLWRFRAHGHPGRQCAGGRRLSAGGPAGQGRDAVLGLAHAFPGLAAAAGSWPLYPRARQRDAGVPGGARQAGRRAAAGAGSLPPQSAQFLGGGGRAAGGKRARLSLSGVRPQLSGGTLQVPRDIAIIGRDPGQFRAGGGHGFSSRGYRTGSAGGRSISSARCFRPPGPCPSSCWPEPASRR